MTFFFSFFALLNIFLQSGKYRNKRIFILHYISQIPYFFHPKKRHTTKQITVAHKMAKKLFIPGPVDVTPDTFQAMSVPMIGHRGSDFSRLLEDCNAGLQKLMYTDNTILIVPASSTGLMEGAIRNCVKEKVLECMQRRIQREMAWHNKGEWKGGGCAHV